MKQRNFYYGRSGRNATTRQAKTRRLVKQGGVSYLFNVLMDMREAGVSYTRRNIIADALTKLGVE